MKKILALALFLSISIPAFAEYKVVTVDINKILNDSSESKTAKAQLDQEYNTAKKQIEAKRDTLKDLEKKIKDGAIKEDSKEAEKYRIDSKEFARLVKDTEDELRKKFLKSNKSLTEKAVKLIKDIAEKNHYDLVLDKSEESRGPVLFATPTADITDQVVKAMNG